jgi:hypothetical protein
LSDFPELAAHILDLQRRSLLHSTPVTRAQRRVLSSG